MKLLDNIITNFAFNVEGKNVRLWVSVELLKKSLRMRLKMNDFFSPTK